MIVRDIMTADPVHVHPESTVADALDVLREMSIRHLPVVTAGRLVGVISDRDLREVTLPAVESIDDPEGQFARRGQYIGDLMQAAPITVGPEDGLDEVIDLLIEHRIGALPVVEQETDELVGIVSYVDVLAAVRDLV